MFSEIKTIEDIIDEKIRSEKLLANACYVVLSSIGRTIWPKETKRISDILKEEFTKDKKRVQVYCYYWSWYHGLEFWLKLNNFRTREANTSVSVYVDWKPTEKCNIVKEKMQNVIDNAYIKIEALEEQKTIIPEVKKAKKDMERAKQVYQDMNYRVRSLVENEKYLFDNVW